ncbi:hypothetical protein ABZ714_26935 [Streptomyces sp. NPDC006798]|uniref:hypothetical protein n=1 Tax=Streptomyces sp. NPDC006798 TaxID=3155462 RepID=UPI0033C78B22
MTTATAAPPPREPEAAVRATARRRTRGSAARPAARLGLLALAVVLLAGCGVRPTGVLDGGEAPGGLTKGMRLYFVSPTGRLEAVPRPELTAEELSFPGTVIKMLTIGPVGAERQAGLVTLVRPDSYEGRYDARFDGESVTIDIPEPDLSPTDARDRNLMGQLVCSFARARAVTEGRGAKRTDDIRVTVRSPDSRFGPYVCSDFLG